MKLAMALVSTMSALVLGLLVSSAKTFYDTQSAELNQMSADIVALDRLLAHYVPEAKEAREELRLFVIRSGRGILGGSKILAYPKSIMAKLTILVTFLSMLGSVLLAQTPAKSVSAGSPPPLIILIGPPLSGKTTFVGSISKTYGIPGISIEDLIKDNAAELERLRGKGVSMAEMRFDPAMSRYLRARLKTTDLSHGLVLDGYPATLVQAEDLSKMIPDLGLKPIAFQLAVPDDVIRERARKSAQESNRPQILEQRIKGYHREMDAISFYFPNAEIVPVDGNQPEGDVWKAIRAGLEGAGITPIAK